MFVVVVECRVQPGRVAEFLAAARDDSRGSVRHEPGCLRFDVVQDNRDETRIWLYEVYRDEAAFEYHQTTPHFQRFDAAIKPLLAEPLRGSFCHEVILTEEARGSQAS